MRTPSIQSIMAALVVLLAACPRAPDRISHPVDATTQPAGVAWGVACDPKSPCGGDLTCRAPCVGWSDEDECIPASTSVCDVEVEPRELPAEQMMTVLTADRPYAIIGRADVFGISTNARFEVLGHGAGFFMAGHELLAEQLDESTRALAGRQFAVMSDSERLCVAGIDGVFVLALEPFVEDQPTPKLGAKIEPERLEYASINGAVFLGLALPKDCGGGLWARDASLPELAFAPARAATGPELERAQASFADSPLHAIEGERFAASGEGEPGQRWIDHRGGDEWGPEWGPEVLAVTLGDRRQVIVSAHVGHVCTGYVGSLTLTYQAEGDSWRPGVFSGESAVLPRVGLDLDQDGELELLAHDGARAWLWSRTVASPSEFAPAPASSGC